MAPNRRHKSHLLTTVLRCRIAACSSIFLKTTEIRQKSAVQRNTTIPSRSISLGPPLAPFSHSAARFHRPFIPPVQAGSGGAASSPGRCSGARAASSSSLPEGRHRSDWGLCSTGGLELREGSTGKLQQRSSAGRKGSGKNHALLLLC